MSLFSPIKSTQVTFPGNSVYEDSKVVLRPWRINAKQCAIFTEISPFHPIDYQWSDQPADQGWLGISGKKVQIQDCLMCARNDEEIFIGHDIPVSRGCEGWEFLVAHIVDFQDIEELGITEGSPVSLHVDVIFRNAISRAHTAAHLMSLALNKALIPYWKKIPVTDSLGSPHFDMLAIDKALVSAHHSQDTYRFGKSIRKKGLNVDAVLENLGQIERNINDSLFELLRLRPKICVQPPISNLQARREWHCQWGDVHATIPCGGTHLLDELLESIHVSLKLTDETNQFLAVTTIVTIKEDRNDVTSKKFIEAI